jgi:Fe-S-cluster containining protein
MSEWWEKGIRFECQGSGKCCVSRGTAGFVYLTKYDRRRLAKTLRISQKEFSEKFCEKDRGLLWMLKDRGRSCVFLEDKACRVYSGRPTQCRTWPFWPENMQAKTWKSDIASFCPGIGKGPVWTKEMIQKQIDLQEKAELPEN